MVLLEMVNDDVLIKYAWMSGHKSDWPDFVMDMKNRMTEMKLGFPGISNNDLSLVEFGTLKPGDLFIHDPYIKVPKGVIYDEAPIMYYILDDNRFYIEGIGKGDDSIRDPLRLNIRWRDILPSLSIEPDFPVFSVDSRPTMNGGPAYYYFFKAYHDQRT